MVPISQAKRLIALLQEQGRAPETMILPDLGHAFPHDKQGTEFLRKLESFLATNLKP